MDPQQDFEDIIADCFLAVGQAIGRDRRLTPEVVLWWRHRYRALFVHALTDLGNSWDRDRDRLVQVGRHLGTRAARLAGGCETIDLDCAVKASLEIEAGCLMNARRESGFPAYPVPGPGAPHATWDWPTSTKH